MLSIPLRWQTAQEVHLECSHILSNRARAASCLGPWSLSVAEIIQVALNKFTELISLQDHILIWVIQKDERTTWRTDVFNT